MSEYDQAKARVKKLVEDYLVIKALKQPFIFGLTDKDVRDLQIVLRGNEVREGEWVSK